MGLEIPQELPELFEGLAKTVEQVRESEPEEDAADYNQMLSYLGKASTIASKLADQAEKRWQKQHPEVAA